MANNTRAGNSAKSIDNNSLSNKDLKQEGFFTLYTYMLLFKQLNHHMEYP